MSRKIRKQLYLEAEQEKRLKRRAKQLRTSEAELIRRGLDLLLSRGNAASPEPRAWEDEWAFIKERAQIPALGRGRSWTREELYDRSISG